MFCVPKLINTDIHYFFLLVDYSTHCQLENYIKLTTRQTINYKIMVRNKHYKNCIN